MKLLSPLGPCWRTYGGGVSFSGDFDGKVNYKERVEESSGDGCLRRGSLGNLGGFRLLGILRDSWKAPDGERISHSLCGSSVRGT